MKNKIKGDTVVYETYLESHNGEPVKTAVLDLQIIDYSGSTVFNDSVSHFGNGTYTKEQNTSGYAIGPLKQIWTAKTSTGTLTDIRTNEIRIVGTDSELDSYVYESELSNYYENIYEYGDLGERENKVVEGYHYINRALENMGYKLPIPLGTDGFYDQALRDWNAYEACYRIISSRQTSYQSEFDVSPWFKYFKDESNRIHDAYLKRKIVPRQETSIGEAGVDKGTKISGTSPGQMVTNWNGYGGRFQGADYDRTWRIEIIGTGTLGEVNECKYRYSNNNGLSWLGTGTTHYDFKEVKDNLYVRFTRGTETGTANIFEVGDKWNVTTKPVRQQTGGKNVARSY